MIKETCSCGAVLEYESAERNASSAAFDESIAQSKFHSAHASCRPTFRHKVTKERQKSSESYPSKRTTKE